MEVLEVSHLKRLNYTLVSDLSGRRTDVNIFRRAHTSMALMNSPPAKQGRSHGCQPEKAGVAKRHSRKRF